MANSPKPQEILAHVAGLQQKHAALEAKLAPLKAERDAHVRKHRAVYETERKLATKIKAVQAEIAPVWEELKAIREALKQAAAAPAR